METVRRGVRKSVRVAWPPGMGLAAGPAWPRRFAGHGPTWIAGWREDRRPWRELPREAAGGYPVAWRQRLLFEGY